MLFEHHFERGNLPPSPPSSVKSCVLTFYQEPPLSESEDFCSACKGAGEFVCCDNCPRVYHFLCCDPPRLEPPTGAFFCHECDARLNPADEHSNTFILFGPLFKELHTTNTRAFSLPPDIQDYFEDVAARPDGRYDEEVKKFPL